MAQARRYPRYGGRYTRPRSSTKSGFKWQQCWYSMQLIEGIKTSNLWSHMTSSVGDLVLMRNHTSKAFQEKYQDSFHVTRLLGKNQLEVKDQNNHVRTVHITDVKKTTMPEVILHAAPDYSQFGRAAKLMLNPNHIEDLGWIIPTKHQNIKMESAQDGKFSKHNFPKDNQSGNTNRYVCLSPETKHILVLEGHWHVQGRTKSLSKLCQLPRSLPVQKSMCCRLQQ